MTAADFFVKSMTAVWNEVLRRVVVVQSQPVLQSVRPKLDDGPFVKLGDRAAAGDGRELCAHCSPSPMSGAAVHQRQEN